GFNIIDIYIGQRTVINDVVDDDERRIASGQRVLSTDRKRWFSRGSPRFSILIPGAAPVRDWSTLTFAWFCFSSRLIRTTEPVRSLFFIIPYPTTTSSSSALVSETKRISSTDSLPTA